MSLAWDRLIASKLGAISLYEKLYNIADAMMTTTIGATETAMANDSKDGGTVLVSIYTIINARTCPIVLNELERATFWKAATTDTITLIII